MTIIIAFIALVGIGSTIVLDLWVIGAGAIARRPSANWGLVGRWLIGVTQGWPIASPEPETFSVAERAVGWSFHYLVGIAYAAMLLLIWGRGYAIHPTLLPVIIVGLVLSTTAGLAILTPALGGGFLASKVPDRHVAIAWSLLAHSVFASSQYGFALITQAGLA